MIYHSISVSSRDSSVVAGVERRQKLAKDQLCGGLARARARKDRHSDTQTYFCQLFPEPPLRKVGTHGEVEEKRVVGVGGGGMAPSSGRRPRLQYVRARDCR